LPALASGLEKIKNPRDQAELARIYPTLLKTSIDYGVMEKATNQIVVEAGFQWDDVGTFDALTRYLKADKHGNFARGDAITIDSRNNIVDNDGRGVIVLAGVNDLLVVRTDDVVLIVPRKQAEKVREVVERLEQEGRADVL
jgi:mannose-1-phosphate guanylyltransferase